MTKTKIHYILALVLLFAASLHAAAQTDNDTYIAAPTTMPVEPITGTQLAPLQAADTLHLPALTMRGEVQPMACLHPLYWGGWNNWSLHSGLNVNVGASVFAQFGKNAYHGAGFSQNISAMYATPLTKHLSMAVGGYFNNTFWMNRSFRDAGLSAVLGYKFNDHWEAYLYGQKSIVQTQHMPPALYDMADMGDRIGAAIKYNVNHNFSFQVSVERGWMPKNDFQLNDRYAYPAPKP